MQGRYVTDILMMCMRKFDNEKYFLTNLQGFDLHIAGVYCKPYLQSISCLVRQSLGSMETNVCIFLGLSKLLLFRVKVTYPSSLGSGVSRITRNLRPRKCILLVCLCKI